MPNPSQVSAQNINTELGVGTTTTLSLGNNWVRNVTTQATGSVDYGKARWGINFPAVISGPFNSSKNYGSSNTLFASVNQNGDQNLGDSTIQNEIEFILYSNGTFYLSAGYNADGGTGSQSNTFTGTWLTSGAAGDYTARIDLTSGSFDVGTTGTDLVLSTTRAWTVSITAVQSGGLVSQVANGTLTIKDSGGTLIARPIYFECEGEITS